MWCENCWRIGEKYRIEIKKHEKEIGDLYNEWEKEGISYDVKKIKEDDDVRVIREQNAVFHDNDNCVEMFIKNEREGDIEMKTEPLVWKLPPKLTPFYIDALKGEIIEKYMKQGITDIQELRGHVYNELPQAVCDVVNSSINGIKKDISSTIEWLKEEIKVQFDMMWSIVDNKREHHKKVILYLIDEAFSNVVEKNNERINQDGEKQI